VIRVLRDGEAVYVEKATPAIGADDESRSVLDRA
jgi:hypothetical protein